MIFNMDNTVIFIDGGYLSFISKHLGEGKPLKFKIEKFAENLAKMNGLSCKEIYYYTAPPYQSASPTESENKRKRNYDKFIQKIGKLNPKIHTREGRCQKDDKGCFHQKGVDTLLTMDLLKVSQKGDIKTIILLTADTDFVPIIKDIQKDYGMKVILAYFTDRKRKSAFSLSNHLWDNCDKKILLKKEDFDGLNLLLYRRDNKNKI